MSRTEEVSALASMRAHSREWLQIALAMLVALPGPVLHTLELTGAPHPHMASEVEALIFGVSILGAATILVWASEVAEQLVSATLALAILAIIAVLPEYAVDLYFAWTAPGNPENAGFALANMTGANRLLVGFAWPLIFFIFWMRERKRELHVGEESSIGLIFLGVATIYSFSIPLRGHLSLIDSVVLISMFVAYLVLSSRAPPREEAELVGPAQAIDALSHRGKWIAIIGLFAFSAGAVFASAEPFATALVDSGESLGIDEFILVQWVAPLASEAPEFILAALLALRGRAIAGMTLLISSKVNQWTLLVGSLPLAYAISDQSLAPLPMDSRQVEEVFLTAGQSLFAVAILMSLSLNAREATLMFLLFIGQLFFPDPTVRWAFGVLYVVLAMGWLIVERRQVPALVQVAREELKRGSKGETGPPKLGP
ncbi:MAG: sodium:calcium antiporter [Dehalococcoidia bacterium]